MVKATGSKNDFLKAIKRADFISYYFYMQMANLLLRVIYNSKITPNMVTLASIIFGLFSGILFMFHYTVLGILIFTLAYIFDCLDGQLARYHKLDSEFGLWFDNVGDRVTETAVIIGLSIGYIESTLLPLVLIGLNVIYWYASDILYHQKRLQSNKKYIEVPVPFILKLMGLPLSKGVTVLIFSLSPFLNVEYVFEIYSIIYAVKIVELIVVEYFSQKKRG